MLNVTVYGNGEGVQFTGTKEEVSKVFEQFMYVGKSGKTTVYKEPDGRRALARAKGPYRTVELRRDTLQVDIDWEAHQYEVHLTRAAPSTDAERSYTKTPVKVALKFLQG